MLALSETLFHMKRIGYTDADMLKKLKALGISENVRRSFVEGIPDFLKKTGGSGRLPGPPRIFISHNHLDRKKALALQDFLKENDVAAYLDEHQDVPGQKVEDRLTNAMIWCEKLLLLWSKNARKSRYVAWEWSFVKGLERDIVLYALDRTPPPRKLRGVEIICRSDETPGHSRLLRTMFSQAENASALLNTGRNSEGQSLSKCPACDLEVKSDSNFCRK
jgi:hypothetical protein